MKASVEGNKSQVEEEHSEAQPLFCNTAHGPRLTGEPGSRAHDFDTFVLVTAEIWGECIYLFHSHS